MTDIANTDPVRAGNAFAVLGACRVRGVVDRALPIAVEQSHPQLFRESAISAVATVGDSSLIPALVDALDPNDQLHLTLVDCIGALTDAATIPTVLPLLLDTDALVSSAFYRFQQLHSREAVDALLAFLAETPTAVNSIRFGSYGDPLWEAMADLWDPRWADTVADLLVAWERAKIVERRIEKAATAILRAASGDERVGRIVLGRFLATGERPRHLFRTISCLITSGAANWLVQQPDAYALMEAVARLGSPEVRQVLAPHLGGLVEQQDEAVAAVRAANQAEEEREEERILAQRNVVLTGDELGSVLAALSHLSAKDWPEVDASRSAWLTQQCEERLQWIDPLRTVCWHAENRLSCNHALPWLVQLIDHYGLRITNDVLLVQSLMACESGPVAAHHRRHGLSEAAVAELERILADPNTPSGAVYHFLGFLGEAEIATPSLGAALVAVADDACRPDHIRSWAIRLAYSNDVPDDELVALAGRLPGGLQDEDRAWPNRPPASSDN